MFSRIYQLVLITLIDISTITIINPTAANPQSKANTAVNQIGQPHQFQL